MKILVTGAAGRLGRQTTKALVVAGHDVLGTDVAFFKDSPAPFEMADLLDAFAVYRMMEGIETVVHIGNHSHSRARPLTQIYSDNMTMQGNVFQAASDHGVSRILYASSVQAICGAPTCKVPGNTHRVPLPASGDSPAYPENPYAVTKRAGEIMLQSHVEQYGLCGVSVRLPKLYASTWASKFRPEHLSVETFCAHLTYADAADFFAHLCVCPLEGYHCFFPAYRETPDDAPVEEIRREYFAGSPLLHPGEPLEYFVDPEPIERITGWKIPARSVSPFAT